MSADKRDRRGPEKDIEDLINAFGGYIRQDDTEKSDEPPVSEMLMFSDSDVEPSDSFESGVRDDDVSDDVDDSAGDGISDDLIITAELSGDEIFGIQNSDDESDRDPDGGAEIFPDDSDAYGGLIFEEETVAPVSNDNLEIEDASVAKAVNPGDVGTYDTADEIPASISPSHKKVKEKRKKDRKKLIKTPDITNEESAYDTGTADDAGTAYDTGTADDTDHTDNAGAVDNTGAANDIGAADDAVFGDDQELPEPLPDPVRRSFAGSILISVAAAAVLISLITGVYVLTAPKRLDNAERQLRATVRGIFGGDSYAEELELPQDSGIDGLYLVVDGGVILGYSANVEMHTADGDMTVAVGVDPERTVAGIVVSARQSDPVVDKDFLDGLIGVNETLLNDSETNGRLQSAVIEGIRIALAVPTDISAIAEERGLRLVGDTETESETETTVITTLPPETEPVETEAPLIPPEVTKSDEAPEIIVVNPNNENPGIHAEFEEDTTEYETLTTEPESGDTDLETVSETEE